ncbi:toll/interleukin-1 receptor domain-containing protein [Streptomyces griseoaurantiacus]|uniref:toll/interleukin-1 receptor domain-containing protein n=1 Tax=Streptomyces griseoaurantiacus TaxID=68213 RepID=UPI0036C42994
MGSTDDLEHDYEVCLSFAGEQRSYVEQVAAELKRAGVRVFYDDYEKVALWGKDLYEHLDYVYGKSAEYCILFASEDYARKVWTNHERRSAQARALTEHGEYVLPVRFDNSEIPGVRTTVGHVDASSVNPATLAKMVVQKLGPRLRKSFIPAKPDRLYEALDVHSEESKAEALAVAYDFMHALERMTLEERRLVTYLYRYACPTGLPGNVHQNLDLLRRMIGWAPQQIIDTMRGISSLGFRFELQELEDHDGTVLESQWNDMTAGSGTTNFAFTRSTAVAHEMVTLAIEHMCEGCAERFIEALDFSSLASSNHQ